jgi:hypothetical protein
MKRRGTQMISRITAVALLALLVVPQGVVTLAATDDPFKEIEKGNISHSGDAPQPVVVCRGWHALCDFATNCEVVGDQANCACWKVKEPYIVETSKIQDQAVKEVTQAICTASHPCDIDEAPVCKAIRFGQFKVDDVKYRWVSTFSYRGWCENWKPVPCGYTEGSWATWADCMSAPCTSIDNPSDPERPLSCQCRVMEGPFIGTQGSCDEGNVMSTEPLGNWDFHKNTFRVPMPGYQFVKGACAELESDN